jgi:hypothetical protein
LSQPLQWPLLAHLEQLARPRHAKWGRLGLMGVRAYISEQLSALGELREHNSQEGSEAGTNLILKLEGENPRLDPLLISAHNDGPLTRSTPATTPPPWPSIKRSGAWSAAGPWHGELKAERLRLRLMVSLEMLGTPPPPSTPPFR